MIQDNKISYFLTRWSDNCLAYTSCIVTLINGTKLNKGLTFCFISKYSQTLEMNKTTYLSRYDRPDWIVAQLTWIIYFTITIYMLLALLVYLYRSASYSISEYFQCLGVPVEQ